ncbi:AraC-like DNA-binding protein [Luteibacter rhizovicinus]|uniref:AraC-like DNA-binding protein n=1 Tax=Luteibacter rhizovicinus TaxID=242606 RepID=A0A4R3YQB9_9GAMM|nr:helix-turn-helix transcriptional regulator [Luteibacter rhizovicinus]TCV93404.1 AraC-like DNA-binding protein [Luteibacter rhizovicinus]
MSTDAQINIVLQAVLGAHLLFVAVWLVAIPRSPRSAAVLLAAFLLGAAGCELVDILQLLGILREQTWLVGVYLPWMYALPPLLYLYTYTLTSAARSPESRQLRWLALGPLAGLLCTVPYLAMEAAQQTAVLDVGYLHIGSSAASMRVPLQLAILAYPLYAAGYLLASFLRLRRHMRVVEGFFSNIEDKTLSWLRWVLLLLCVALAASVVDTFSEPLLGYHLIGDTAANLIEALWVYPLTFLALAQPPIFADEGERASAQEASIPSPPKYARSALTGVDLVRIAAKLQQAMHDARLYRDASLTLRSLSDLTGVPQNYISQTLNIHLGCSFFDYINRWRIEDACAQLADGERSILTISEDVGFQSRSTFNAAFKKIVGQTPSIYRQRASAPEPYQSEA